MIGLIETPKFAGHKVFCEHANAWYVAKLSPSGRLAWVLVKQCGGKGR